jgi:hypothetical protein
MRPSRRLEESLRLRRDIGFRPGEPEQAGTLLAEAAAEAGGGGACGVLRWIDAARAELAATG